MNKPWAVDPWKVLFNDGIPAWKSALSAKLCN
jgi:hypothetical protein